jgi:hypothetical protein
VLIGNLRDFQRIPGLSVMQIQYLFPTRRGLVSSTGQEALYWNLAMSNASRSAARAQNVCTSSRAILDGWD